MRRCAAAAATAVTADSGQRAAGSGQWALGNCLGFGPLLLSASCLGARCLVLGADGKLGRVNLNRNHSGPVSTSRLR